MLVGGTELTVIGEGEVRPLVGGEFLESLHLSDPGNPTSDDTKAKVAVFELKVHPGAVSTVSVLVGNDGARCGIRRLDPKGNGVSTERGEDLKAGRSVFLFGERGAFDVEEFLTVKGKHSGWVLVVQSPGDQDGGLIQVGFCLLRKSGNGLLSG